MNPLLPNMANLFPWKDHQSNLHKALSWIRAAVGSVFSFIPFGGALLKVPQEIEGKILDGVSDTAGHFSDAALGTLSYELAPM